MFIGFKEFEGMTDEHKDLLKRSTKLLESNIEMKNYADRFKFLISCEEHQMNIDIRNYDMKVPVLFLSPHVFHLFSVSILFSFKLD